MITSISDLTSERIRRREARIRQLEQERDAREAALLLRVPRLSEIKSTRADIGLDLARMVLKLPTRRGLSFDALKSLSLRLSEEWTQLLQQHGVDPQELEVQWDCQACKNTGWLPAEQAGPDRVLPQQKCHCLIQEEINDLYQAAGLTGPLRSQNFDRFDLSVYPPADRQYMGQLRDFCLEYAGRIARGVEERSLMLTGAVGLGKTFLSSAIANTAVQGHRTVVYFTFADFLDLVRFHRFDDDSYQEGMRRLLDADLIVLDDLGAEKVTDFVGQELFNVINHRMNRNRPMVISTNLAVEEIKDLYGERIHSRLTYGFEVLALKGEDVRKVLVRRQRQV